jgi:hypothetical protein
MTADAELCPSGLHRLPSPGQACKWCENPIDCTFSPGELPHLLPADHALPKYRHGGCTACTYLGHSRVKTDSPRGLGQIELLVDLWFCPKSDTAGRTVIARWSSEPQDFYSARYPLSTTRDYQPALREAALKASQRGYR